LIESVGEQIPHSLPILPNPAKESHATSIADLYEATPLFKNDSHPFPNLAIAKFTINVYHRSVLKPAFRYFLCHV
jgi:hypothetical protein